MSTVVEAVYKSGTLILNRRLDHIQEGQTVRVILTELTEPEVVQSRFWRFVKDNTITLPADYVFQRENLYER